MKVKLQISDQRMLTLMAYAIENNLAPNESEYLSLISFPRQNIGNIKRGHQSFTRDHIYHACKFTGANANWVFGFESQMMRKQTKNPLEKLKEAAIEIESLLKVGKNN